MEASLWVSKTGLDAQQTNVAVISNNLANVSTIGYKRGRAIFEDLFYQTIREPGASSSQNTQFPTGFMKGTGVKLVATQKNFIEGNILNTGNGLDLAIIGRGMFQILLPDGTTAYTRAGTFMLDNTGQMVTPSGNVLQPTITIPAQAQSITISTDGVVSVSLPNTTTPTQVGTIQLADFINPPGLKPMGENLFLETNSSGSPTTGNPGSNGMGTTLQGSLESSNVNVVEELVGLIEAQRAYELNAKSIETVDQMLQFATQTL